MDRETVLRIAREAGLVDFRDTPESLPESYIESIEALAALAYEAGLQKGQELAGEFICRKCGMRQDGEKVEPNF